MRFICSDPMQTVSRVIDIARRLGLALEELKLNRLGNGDYRIAVTLARPESHEAAIFLARAMELIDLTPETVDA